MVCFALHISETALFVVQVLKYIGLTGLAGNAHGSFSRQGMTTEKHKIIPYNAWNKDGVVIIALYTTKIILHLVCCLPYFH